MERTRTLTIPVTSQWLVAAWYSNQICAETFFLRVRLSAMHMMQPQPLHADYPRFGPHCAAHRNQHLLNAARINFDPEPTAFELEQRG